MSEAMVFCSRRFGKSVSAKVLSEFFNSDKKLCDIIEEMYPDFSHPTKKMIMDICESAIPLMIRFEKERK